MTTRTTLSIRQILERQLARSKLRYPSGSPATTMLERQLADMNNPKSLSDYLSTRPLTFKGD